MTLIRNQIFKDKQVSRRKFVDNNKYFDCQFENCNFSNFRFTNCEFENCLFRNCDFTRCFLAQNVNYESGKFLSCKFLICNFRETSFRFPIIDHCEFRNCTLYETNFDGSRISNTTFIGELDSCFFRGYSIYANKTSVFSFSKLDPYRHPNKMINVNFRLTKLKANSFSHRIDLSGCLFPIGEDYIFIANLKETMSKAIEIISKEWPEGYIKETGLKIIRLVYYAQGKTEQKSDFIDKHIIMEEANREDNEGVGLRFFDLIKSLQ